MKNRIAFLLVMSLMFICPASSYGYDTNKWAPDVGSLTGGGVDDAAIAACDAIEANAKAMCAGTITSSGNTPRGGPTPLSGSACTAFRNNSQGISQCLALKQSRWSIFFATYMIPLDAAAFSSCAAACLGLLTAPESPSTEAWNWKCNATGTIDGIADFTDQKVLGAKMGQSFWGEGVSGAFGTSMGILGLAGGVAGMAP